MITTNKKMWGVVCTMALLCTVVALKTYNDPTDPFFIGLISFIITALVIMMAPITLLLFFTTLIEGLIFKFLIKNIEYEKAFSMAAVGNLISLLFILTSLLYYGSQPYYYKPFIFSSTLILLATLFITTTLIELCTIKIFFHYRFKQLSVPVLAGNLVTSTSVILIKQLLENT